MDQDIIDLYDEYTHAPLPRRVFLERLAQLTGSMAAAMAILPLIGNQDAAAAVIPPDDSRLDARTVTYKGATGNIRAYMVRPRNTLGDLPAVLVIHENRGLNPHIEDVARRIALEGFVAMAPDLLSPLGGTPGDRDKARDMIGQLDRQQTVQNLIAGVDFLGHRPSTNGKVGVVGFCWGGGNANQLAVHDPEVDAVVAYYGPQPKASEVPQIEAPLLLHYGALDKRIGAGIPAYEDALKQNGKDYAIYIYEGANHAFNNDTDPSRYNKAAATLAWSRTIDFLKKNLAG